MDKMEFLTIVGNGQAQVHCFDGKKRLAIICGRLRNRVWINPKFYSKILTLCLDDIVLVSLRPFQDAKCDITHKYFPEESKQLKAMGELPYSLDIDKKDN
jgi:translation initiation factor 1A